MAKLTDKQVIEQVDPTFDEISQWYDENLHPDRLCDVKEEVFKNVYEEGRWANIFQFTSSAGQAFIQKFNPKSVIDVATATSIFRPGPLNAHVDELYLKNVADPGAIKYKHPLVREILDVTKGCLVGSTRVMTEDGEFSIEEIVEKQMMYAIPSFNLLSNEIEKDDIIAAICTGEKETLSIELEDGSSLELTDDHQVLTERGWISASEISLNDTVFQVEDYIFLSSKKGSILENERM